MPATTDNNTVPDSRPPAWFINQPGMASTSALAMRASSSVFRGRALNGTEANKVYSKTGAIRPNPGRTKFASLKVASVVVPGLWAGAVISQTAADLMEKHDIFRPAEDDD